MSLSKLESLPNEILTDIIENYIDGVDILKAFNYQLNRRFNALIAQCHRLRFNFVQCRKDDFSFCMGLLPAYAHKIEELRLSEQNTPGQIHAFLSFFPLFTPFKRLRTLYFHFDAEAVDRRMVEKALYSLSDTNITTLSIEMIKTDNTLTSDGSFTHLFQLETLKRFCLVNSTIHMDWSYFSHMPSNVEYLSIPGGQIQLQQLQSIFQLAPRLKYLDIGKIQDTFFVYQKSNQNSKKNIIPASALHTLILSFEEENEATLDELAPYFSAMPVLNRLEIIANTELVDANAWESLFQKSLPLLKHFTLRTTISRLHDIDIQNLQDSLQNSFWLARENFNIMITDHKNMESYWSDRIDRQNLDQYDFKEPVVECSIAPIRVVNNGFNIVKDITSLRISPTSRINTCHHYFENIKCLIVDNMDQRLFEWMTTYVNCSGITELFIVPSSFTAFDKLDFLLTSIPRIELLHTSFDLLMDNKDVFVGKMNCLKSLAIFTFEHMFKEENINIIAKLFPSIEHIQINTSDIHNVPLLERHLPDLRSLSVNISHEYPPYSNTYGRQRWSHELREKNNFLFKCHGNSLTVWIDNAAYQEPYWKKYLPILPQSVAASTATVTSDNRNKKKKLKFPFLNFFK